MISKILKGNINFLNKAESWKDAIIESAKPLLAKGYITEEYPKAIIRNVEENGPYIVIIPEVAIPHARTEYGALETGLSCLILENSVVFPSEKEVKILITLSAKDNNSHLELLEELATILMDEKIVNQIKNANTENEVLGIISNVDY